MEIPFIVEQDFEREVVKSELPVLIYFTKSGDSKTTASEVAACFSDYPGKVKLVRIDIEKSKRLATSLRIQSVPLFIVYFKGRPVASEQGVLPKKKIIDLVEPFMPRDEEVLHAAQLAQLLRINQVVAIDTRDSASYAQGHIPNAIHMPLAEVETNSWSFEPVFYCQTGKQTQALAARMAELGISINFLEGGYMSWVTEGLPIES